MLGTVIIKPCSNIRLILIHYFFLFSTVTRSVKRALAEYGIQLPQRIIKRRQTFANTKKPQPLKRTARVHTTEGTVRVPPRVWCICRRTSFGNMIFCDSPACVILWFHMECLKMDKEPTTVNWYCANCTLLQQQFQKAHFDT